jgi:hypothetical protein
MKLILHEFIAESTVVSMRVSSHEKNYKKEVENLSGRLCSLSHNVSARLKYYYELCILLENLFNNTKNDFQGDVAEVAEMIQHDDSTGFVKEYQESQFLEQQWLFGERIEVQEAAVSIGIFLKAYAMLEDILNALCDIYQELREETSNFRDLEGGGIVRAANYIKQLVNIDNFLDDDWKKLRLWNTVRNQVMHEDAKMNDDPRLFRAMRLLGISSIIDTTVGKTKVINLELKHVKDFLVLIDVNLSKFVLHEDNWG